MFCCVALVLVLLSISSFQGQTLTFSFPSIPLSYFFPTYLVTIKVNNIHLSLLILSQNTKKIPKLLSVFRITPKTAELWKNKQTGKLPNNWMVYWLVESLSRFVYPGQRTSECELGEWSQWSSCMKKNKTCGFRKGSQSRFRGPLLQVHSPDTSPAFVPSQTCAPQTERRKCVVTKTPCVRGKPKKSRHTRI